MLAAVAHLSFFTGFWFAAPIALYVIKRKESRFVAYQALQAVMVQVLFGGAAVVGAIGIFIVAAAAGIVGDRHPLAALFALLPIFAIAMGGLAVVVVHLVAAYRAWQGERWSIPIVGRLASAILNADEGAAKS